MFAFALTHLDQFRERGRQGLLQNRPRFCGVDTAFGRTHDARRLQNCSNCDFTGGAQFFLQGEHRFVVGAGQTDIKCELWRPICAFLQDDQHIHATA